MNSFKKFRDSLIDIVKTPQAPKMGKIPLPEVEEDEVLVPCEPSLSEEASSEGSEPVIVAPTPRKPMKSLSSLSRGVTPQPAPAPILTPALKQQFKYYHRTTTPSPELKKTTSRSVPEKPPKSPLDKPPRSPHDNPGRESNERRGSRSSQDRPSRSSQDRSPNAPPPPSSSSRSSDRPSSPTSPGSRPLKGILKPAPVRLPSQVFLHWQLLPYMPHKRALYFDVSQDPVFIRDHTRPLSPRAHDEEEMEKPAANVSFTTMTIRIRSLEQWDIIASHPGGLSCRDVFDAIYNALQEPLTEEERKKYIPRGSNELRQAQKALKQRCQKTPVLSAVTERQNILRVDLLGDQTVFMGLTQDIADRFWVLELGKPKNLRSGA